MITLMEILDAEERSLGAKIKILSWAQLKPNIIVVTYIHDSNPMPESNKIMRSYRIAGYTSEGQVLFSNISKSEFIDAED